MVCRRRRNRCDRLRVASRSRDTVCKTKYGLCVSLQSTGSSCSQMEWVAWLNDHRTSSASSVNSRQYRAADVPAVETARTPACVDLMSAVLATHRPWRRRDVIAWERVKIRAVAVERAVRGEVSPPALA